VGSDVLCERRVNVTFCLPILVRSTSAPQEEIPVLRFSKWLTRPSSRSLPRSPTPLQVESLEDRWMPAATVARPAVLADMQSIAAAVNTPVPYLGGEVLHHVRVVTVFYGDAWRTDPILQQQSQRLDGFFGTITDSTYMDMLGEYGVGRGSFWTQVNTPLSQPVNPDGTLGEVDFNGQDVHDMLAGAINDPDSPMPVPDAETLYMVFPAPNVQDPGMAGATGYHDPEVNGQVLHFGVVFYPGSVPDPAAFDDLTATSSHELAEAATDPNGDGWNNLNVAEIGDMAFALPGNPNGWFDGYLVQSLWSNDQMTRVLPPGAVWFDPSSAGATWLASDPVALQSGMPGAATPGVFDPTTATWYLRGSNSAGAPDAGQFAFGAPGWVPVVGDWDGNGTTTVGVFDPATATWYLRNENSAGAPDAGRFQFGAPGWVPVVGDWTGSGKTGIGVFDPSTGTFYLRNEASAGSPDAGRFAYGAPGWVPLAGDWTGSDKTGIGVFDPGTSTFYLRNEASSGTPDAGRFAFGAPGWVPLAGDWTGSGHSGIGVFDPGSATFYLRNETSAGAPDAGQFAYGAPGWRPVVGNFAVVSSAPAPAARRDPLTDAVLSFDDLLPGARHRTDVLDQVFANGL
jgi:hypothetical protein